MLTGLHFRRRAEFGGGQIDEVGLLIHDDGSCALFRRDRLHDGIVPLAVGTNHREGAFAVGGKSVPGAGIEGRAITVVPDGNPCGPCIRNTESTMAGKGAERRLMPRRRGAPRDLLSGNYAAMALSNR